MTTDELLMPRYKVIADYPGTVFDVNQILEVSGDCAGSNRTGSGVLSKSVYKPEKYPAIFRPMPWYEERKVGEMPEYVKNTYREGMVNDIFVYAVKKHFTRDMTGVECGIKEDAKYWTDENDFSHLYIHYAPATLQDFNDYINSKK